MSLKLIIFAIISVSNRFNKLTQKMDYFQIETAQNISINQNVAHVTTRIGSFLIDLLIIIAYNILIFLYQPKDSKNIFFFHFLNNGNPHN